MNFLRVAALAAAALSAAACTATADISDTFGRSSSPNAANAPQVGGPPAGYNQQHWISPNGCSYSRAQAPGYAPTWHLILNGAHVGLTDAHRGCKVMYTQRG